MFCACKNACNYVIRRKLSMSKNVGVISDKILTVQSKDDAIYVLDIMRNHPNNIYACDTEVANINIKDEGPVGN
jgi:hypothetical protein